MNNTNPRTVVRRSSAEYGISFMWTLPGLMILYMVIFEHRAASFTILIFLSASFFHTCNLFFMYLRPLIKLEAEYLIVHPHVFSKIIIRINDIKGLRMYENIRKTILTPQQVQRNNTLIVDQVDGKSIPINMKWLTVSVRQNISDLAKELNLSLDYQENKRISS